MKRLRLVSLAAMMALLCAPVMAADAPAAASANSIAVINFQLIMNDSTAAKSVHEQLDSKQKLFQSEISKKQDQLQKDDQELGKQRSVLSKDAFEEKVSKLRARSTDFQKEVQSKKALLDNAFSRSLANIQKVATDIIADMAKEKGFIVTIPTSQILYSDPKLDITDEVMKRLNQKLPKVDVKFDAPSDK